MGKIIGKPNSITKKYKIVNKTFPFLIQIHTTIQFSKAMSLEASIGRKRQMIESANIRVLLQFGHKIPLIAQSIGEFEGIIVRFENKTLDKMYQQLRVPAESYDKLINDYNIFITNLLAF